MKHSTQRKDEEGGELAMYADEIMKCAPVDADQTMKCVPVNADQIKLYKMCTCGR